MPTTFPSDRHPDYYEGARTALEALTYTVSSTQVWLAAKELLAANTAAEQAMRAAQERAMASLVVELAGAVTKLEPVVADPAEMNILAHRFTQGDGEVAP